MARRPEKRLLRKVLSRWGYRIILFNSFWTFAFFSGKYLPHLEFFEFRVLMFLGSFYFQWTLSIKVSQLKKIKL